MEALGGEARAERGVVLVGAIAACGASADSDMAITKVLRDQQANVDRYEAWRGGLRTTEDGPTGASVAMAMARREAQVAGIIVIAGVLVFALGFMFR